MALCSLFFIETLKFCSVCMFMALTDNTITLLYLYSASEATALRRYTDLIIIIIISHLSPEMTSKTDKMIVRLSIRCQHFPNAKTPRLLGWRRLNLACRFCAPGTQLLGILNFGRCTVQDHPKLSAIVLASLYMQLIFTETKETAKCQFGCKVLRSRILNFGVGLRT